MHASLLTLLIRSIALFVATGSAAWAEDSARLEPPLARVAPFDSATLLRQAIAALLPMQDPVRMRERSDAEPELDVDFASGSERDRVSVSLADSELRVRLGEKLRLHCEVSSRDELYSAPELGIDLALRFKFQ